MNIKRVSNVILAVKNLENSLKFYHEILGMPIKNHRDNWVDLGQSGGSFLSLHQQLMMNHTQALLSIMEC